MPLYIDTVNNLKESDINLLEPISRLAENADNNHTVNVITGQAIHNNSLPVSILIIVSVVILFIGIIFFKKIRN